MPPGRSTPIRPSKMFADADALQSKGKFEDAAKKFEDVDREHPYSPEARRAIVMAAYAYYKAGKLPEAIASAERYTTMHPGTKEAPLAHHIIASVLLRADEAARPRSGRDAQGAGAATRSLKTRYPGQHLRAEGRQPDPPVRGHAGGAGDERRPLLHGQEQPRRGHQPLQDGGHRLPDDGARGRGAVPPDGRLPVARHRAGGAERRRRAGAQLPQLVLVQGILRAAEEAGPDASGQPGLVDDGRAAGPGQGPAGAAAHRQGQAGARRPIGRQRRPRSCRRRLQARRRRRRSAARST